jgi:hypothetical protein
MNRSPRPFRVLVGVALLAGMVLLWTGSVIHYGNGDPNDPAALLADAHAYPGAAVAKAVTDVASTLAFLLGVIGLVAIVRGRGRAVTIGVAMLLALGVPAHVFGASFFLTVAKISQADLPAPVELRVVTELAGLQNLYFAALVPFLLAMLLIPAALWRARIVSWIPLALIAADLIVVGRFTSSTTPSSPLWWVDPAITIVAYGWLAVGVARYVPSDERVPAPLIEPVPA